jgi:hypothetical protein
MNKKLDTNFRKWLNRLANDWNMPIDEAAKWIGLDEAQNRIAHYPSVRAALSTSPMDIRRFADAAGKCWVLGGQFDATRFGIFVKSGDSAVAAIQNLIDDFPDDADAVIKRVDGFIADAIDLGYRINKGSSDWAGVAQLASLILTALYPNRFVDYRQNRWKRLAETFDYEQPPARTTHGGWLVWASQFAREVTATPTYQQYWPESDSLWTIAGISWNWKGKTPPRPPADPIDAEDVASFPEGTKKRRLHLIRERSRAVVSKAKELGLERDPLLRCQVCGFSFVETYGELGRGFIEAHHTQPVATLKPGSRTKVEDIALVCPNCHEMLHRGSLDLDQLRAIMRG